MTSSRGTPDFSIPSAIWISELLGVTTRHCPPAHFVLVPVDQRTVEMPVSHLESLFYPACQLHHERERGGLALARPLPVLLATSQSRRGGLEARCYWGSAGFTGGRNVANAHRVTVRPSDILCEKLLGIGVFRCHLARLVWLFNGRLGDPKQTSNRRNYWTEVMSRFSAILGKTTLHLVGRTRKHGHSSAR